MSNEFSLPPDANPDSARTVNSKAPPNRVNGLLVGILIVLTGILVFQMASQQFGWFLPPLHDPDAQPRAIVARGNLAEDEQSTIALFRDANVSVVHITSLQVKRDRFSVNLFELPQGTGSGFVWDGDGHIVTNYHVIRQAQTVRVNLGGNSVYQARFVGADPDNDIAVLKIDAPANQLHPIPIGESNNLLVGQKVFAIGNPFGLDQTLTTGVISGLGREIQSVTRRPIRGVIQTDAAINPGNSGGPLLDSAGRLIGINTAIYSPSGAYAGIGFAVPVDTVNMIVPRLIRHGKIEQPGLGIIFWSNDVLRQLQERGVITLDGVLVRSVLEGSAAEKAELEPTIQNDEGDISWGDLIVSIDGVPIPDPNALFKFLEEKQVGDVIAVRVVRDGQQKELQLTLQPLPRSPE